MVGTDVDGAEVAGILVGVVSGSLPLHATNSAVSISTAAAVVSLKNLVVENDTGPPSCKIENVKKIFTRNFPRSYQPMTEDNWHKSQAVTFV